MLICDLKIVDPDIHASKSAIRCTCVPVRQYPVKENPVCRQSSNMEATFLVLIIWSEIHSWCQCLLKFNSLAPAVY